MRFVPFDRVLSSVLLLVFLAASICMGLSFSYRKEKQLVKYTNECRPKITGSRVIFESLRLVANPVKGESEASTMQLCLLIFI